MDSSMDSSVHGITQEERGLLSHGQLGHLFSKKKKKNKEREGSTERGGKPSKLSTATYDADPHGVSALDSLTRQGVHMDSTTSREASCRRESGPNSRFETQQHASRQERTVIRSQPQTA
jgi:hypothetical protein